MHPPTFAYYKT